MPVMVLGVFSYPGVAKDTNNIIINNTSNYNQSSITHFLAFFQVRVCQSINQSQTGIYTFCVRTQWHLRGRLGFG